MKAFTRLFLIVVVGLVIGISGCSNDSGGSTSIYDVLNGAYPQNNFTGTWNGTASLGSYTDNYATLSTYSYYGYNYFVTLNSSIGSVESCFLPNSETKATIYDYDAVMEERAVKIGEATLSDFNGSDYTTLRFEITKKGVYSDFRGLTGFFSLVHK